MIGGASPLFLDTNILVYANIAASPMHHAALHAIQNRQAAGVELWISRQVLREYIATLSRPQTYTAYWCSVFSSLRLSSIWQKMDLK